MTPVYLPLQFDNVKENMGEINVVIILLRLQN